ncbi:sucrose-6-phosphate hydrolase [Planomicrobium sp. CPCC 101079]|uniref:glycoside hydrolase family 32 protein n=1 Tax=Planomicrobium sp. CPCC 101079 TaxID=2599618 RepID=UPI0011B81B35|nr:sucrose-6-phosphate hydrolase [Planomicrobium sp. CPCC 101079]TWT13152.1 sucrose-6-phosphate hydrolase [Planomicrobium sp. CPCC 101079]
MQQLNWFERISHILEAYKENNSLDPHRLQFHLMPAVGLLNDPNGLIQYKGTYHVFFQWNPFGTVHGPKCWGHYTSRDLVYWQEHQPSLVPSEWYEKDGCYSGSAVEVDGDMVLFYSGNVNHEDGTHETFQCMAVSHNGFDFVKKGPVVLLPEGYTAHFRDPKVWQRDGVWYMVVGAQTFYQEGAVVLFSSSDLVEWELKGILAGSHLNGLTNFGYMWECPDFFELDDQDVLLVSPQGLEAKESLYQNEFQSGYFVGKWKAGTTEFPHGEFHELDRGFDFYAPQTFEDKAGRRIMLGWMGITDEQQSYLPTIEKGWIHALTIPRELELREGRIIQKPVQELKQMREWESFEYQTSLENETRTWPELAGIVSELMIRFQQNHAETIEIEIRKNLSIVFDKQINRLTLKRKRFADGEIESRSCFLDKLEDLHIYLDTSAIEIFVNGGQEVFTARFFAEDNEKEIIFTVNGRVDIELEKWNLRNPKEL